MAFPMGIVWTVQFNFGRIVHATHCQRCVWQHLAWTVIFGLRYSAHRQPRPRRLPLRSIRCSAAASNKPHSAEKSTPVWLAIWRTCAGFANSQLRCATLHSTYSYMYPSTLLPAWSSCSDIANLSAHLHRLPTPPPYLRLMRLSPGRAQVLSAG